MTKKDATVLIFGSSLGLLTEINLMAYTDYSNWIIGLLGIISFVVGICLSRYIQLFFETRKH